MKFLSGIRKKILIGFFLAIITLLSTGLVAFYSLENMLSAVDEFAVPDKSVSLMYDISTDLGLISNYNRIYSITNDREYQKKIENASDETIKKIDSLASLLSNDSLKVKQIDSLKILLSDISGESKKLAKAKNSIDVDKITARLAKQILDQVKSDSSLINDSSFIVKNTTSKIRESNFSLDDLDKIDSLSRQNDQLKDINFFQKLGFLFSKKRPSNLIDTLYLLPDKKVDTLTTVSRDSVVYLTKSAFINNLDSLLKAVQKEESQVQNRIRQMELAFTHHNNDMIEKARSILTSINQSTIHAAFEEIDTISAMSKKSKQIILYMIVLFAVAGIILIIFVLADISKSNYYQEELINAKKISDQSAKAKLDFLAKMSHEIRTPLTSILGFSGMLNNQKSEYVKIIKNSSEQLLNTANEILDLAKVDSGIIEINKEPFDLNKFLNYLMLDFEMKSASKDFEFDYEIENGQKVVIFSDELRLRQILSNILNNAFKFTEKGQVNFTCHYEKITNETVQVLIRIVDSGVGINKSDLQKIFLEYEQAGTTALKKQGFGLGLSIVKKLVHLLNGTMNVYSKPGKGTTFSLNFRFELASETVLVEDKTQPKSDLLRGISILIIDDDKTILKLFSTILKKYGATIETCEIPSELWKQLKSKRFDLCLMDIQLSGHNGVDLCRKIKSQEEYHYLKIIASTANLIGSSKEDLVSAGFDHILFKPVNENDLVNEIGQTLNINTGGLESKPEHTTNSKPIEDELNLDDIRKFTFGDDDALKEVLEQFVADTNKDMRLLEKSLKEKDTRLAKDVFHRLSSRLSQFGANKLAIQSKSLEKKIHEHHKIPSEETEKLIDSCKKMIAQTEAKMISSHYPG